MFIIETRAQYIRTQASRWNFYKTLEEVEAHPFVSENLDPRFNEIYSQAIRSQIAELEAELEEYERRVGPWPSIMEGQ